MSIHLPSVSASKVAAVHHLLYLRGTISFLSDVTFLSKGLGLKQTNKQIVMG